MDWKCRSRLALAWPLQTQLLIITRHHHLSHRVLQMSGSLHSLPYVQDPEELALNVALTTEQ